MALVVSAMLALALVAGACGQSADTNAHPAQGDEPARTSANVLVSQASLSFGLLPSQSYATTVSEVVDGDTITAQVAGKSQRIRLIGIDTPEDSVRERECGGAEATAFLGELIPPGTEILLTRGQEAYDIYDRLLAYVFRASDGLLVNLAMAEYGMASELSFGINTHFLPQFRRAENTAKRNGLGVWGQCGGTDTPL